MNFKLKKMATKTFVEDLVKPGHMVTREDVLGLGCPNCAWHRYTVFVNVADSGCWTNIKWCSGKRRLKPKYHYTQCDRCKWIWDAGKKAGKQNTTYAGVWLIDRLIYCVIREWTAFNLFSTVRWYQRERADYVAKFYGWD